MVELKFKYIDQKSDGLEGWVQAANSPWIRLDFILEFYLFGNMDLSNDYKRRSFRNHQTAKEYADGMYEKVKELMKSGKKVNFESYIEWQQKSFDTIRELSNSLNQI